MAMLKYYRLANLLSIDVVVGSVCSALFFSRVFSQRCDVPALFTLALTVWVVYTVDHLRDSQASQTFTTDSRRLFHLKHRRSILAALAIAIIIILTLIVFLPRPVIVAGVALVIPIAAYLFLQKRIAPFKEILVSVMYTAGVLLPSIRGLTHIGQHLLVVGGFFLIALINLLLFSLYDHNRDLEEKQASAVTSWGRSSAKGIIYLCFVGAGILIGLQPLGLPSMVLSAMLLLHLGILIFWRFFSLQNRYRLFGDAIFYLPGIAVLSQRWI